MKAAILAVVGALSLVASQTGPPTRVSVNIATVALLAFLLTRGSRRRDALRPTRLLLSGALASVFLAGLLELLFQAATGSRPSSPWYSDGVALCYVPLAVAGLLRIPSATPRVGHRARAVADGMLAATSLWYLLLTLGVDRAAGGNGLAGIVALAYPVGDAFVVSVGLAVLARCAVPARKIVTWMVAGLCVESANDVWRAAATAGASLRGPDLLYQLGLLLLVGAAAAPAVPELEPGEHADDPPWTLAVAPFIPLFACMTMTSRMILHGAGIPRREALPALAVALALAARQLAISKDRKRLVVRLLDRERTLEAALRRDELTGLSNRLGLTDSLAEILDNPAMRPVAIALLDLDDFKLINDNHGHAVGDEVLREVGRRLRWGVRHSDVVARLGGDEFAVVAAGVDDTQRLVLAERLIRCFEEPVRVGDQSFSVVTSIGLVLGEPSESAGSLLSHADAAMYRAKAARARSSRIRVLSGKDREDVSRDLRIREDIATPDLDEFSVMYQPVVDLATGRIRGVEALARWQHPQFGPIPPDLFIPLAEVAGSITALGDHVLATALADFSRFRSVRPGHRLAVGVNVSPRQLADPSFVARVLDLIGSHRIDPDQLVLEITEQAFEADLDPVADSVGRLAAASVSVAVDDFGTGYASLRYLQRLKLEIMKIDRTFVSEVMTCKTSRDLVTAVAAMGVTLGLQVIAEGIETIDQLRILQEINCELGQGYLFSPPMDAGAMEMLLLTGHVFPVGAGEAAPLPLGQSKASVLNR